MSVDMVAEIRKAQEAGLTCALVDPDPCINLLSIRDSGADLARLLYARPTTAEQTEDVMCGLARSGKVGLLVFAGELNPDQRAKVATLAEQTKTRVLEVHAIGHTEYGHA